MNTPLSPASGTARDNLREYQIDGRTYQVQVNRRVSQPLDAPRLVVVSHQTNEWAKELLRVCIQAIQHFTPGPYELWVVDNHSPAKHLDWLQDWPGLNLGLNRTEPLPAEGRSIWGRLHSRWRRRPDQRNWPSYANAIGLEIGARLIDPDSKYLMTLHMDTMPCHPGWLDFLSGQIGGKIAAAGVRMDHARVTEGVLHVLGYLIDFQIFQRQKLDFFPQLPAYDVGDRVTVNLRAAGYQVAACPNTLHSPELVDRIPPNSPLRALNVDRAFNERGEVIFLHFGRGVQKSVGVESSPKQASKQRISGVQPEEWVRFAQDYLLAQPTARP